MLLRGPIAQPGLELPAHNRLVPGSNPGGPIPFVPAATTVGLDHHDHKTFCATRTRLVEVRLA
jgi:hypothetical protein